MKGKIRENPVCSTSDQAALLIHHGLIASITDVHLFHRLIQSGNHLISLARPGYGESSPYLMRNIAEWGDIVSVLVEELNLSQFDILGMFSGAPYSHAVGYPLPDKVRHIFIFSGIPALYDKSILAFWPYPVTKNAGLPENVPFITAQMTAKLLPKCQFDVRESGEHFSQKALEDFLETAVTGVL